MFVWSMRASTIKFFGIVAISVAALLTLIAFIPTYEPVTVSVPGLASESAVNYDKIKTNDDRISFLGQFGWQVKSTPLEEANITVPDEFDKVFFGYNELQKQQGLNLEKYKRKTMKRYTYEITNYSDWDGVVYANLLVYRGRVVGGDVCTADANGFIHGFSKD